MTASTCPESGKVVHRSPQAAHAAIRHVERRGAKGRSQRESAYACDACNGWHVRSRGLRPAGRR